MHHRSNGREKITEKMKVKSSFFEHRSNGKYTRMHERNNVNVQTQKYWFCRWIVKLTHSLHTNDDNDAAAALDTLAEMENKNENPFRTKCPHQT